MPLITTLAGASARGYGGLLTFGAPDSFESIATATGTGSSGTITFSSIPSTYQHLQIRGIAKRSTTTSVAFSNLAVIFNSDTAANYARHNLDGDGAIVSTGIKKDANEILVNGVVCNSEASMTNLIGVCIIDILDYASTNKNKTLRGFSAGDNNSTAGEINFGGGVWMNTSAITTITLSTIAGNFTTQTTFALYGIKGA